MLRSFLTLTITYFHLNIRDMAEQEGIGEADGGTTEAQKEYELSKSYNQIILCTG
jgi:hypothetical protein